MKRQLLSSTITPSSSRTLLHFSTFLAKARTPTRSRMSKVNLKQYVRTTSRNAMHFLAESPNITKLHIEGGLFAEKDPVKAAKFFDNDARKFLQAVGAKKGDKAAGVDVLSFGKQALTYKDDKKNVKEWPEELVGKFKENLKGKLT